ncbi:MAG: aldehyde dehydrogenase family protein [Microbacteriaceae bacterium]|nr:aldehyde dehydrogenase family protein [Actinomycetota bacterium]
MGNVANRHQIYINGAWVDSESTELIEVFNPSTEELLGTIVSGTAGDVDRAVEAAVAAFPAWSALPGAERGAYLKKTQELLMARLPELAALVSQDLGSPDAMARAVQIGLPMTNLGIFADLAASFSFDDEEVGNSLIVREPVGVVGAITPWNYPLHQIVLKVGGALAAGCTVVLKASVEAPFISYALADIFDEIGLPAGVFNLVSGRGSVIGEAISSHPDIDMISFTGSNGAGKRISIVAAETVKKVSLELGGKSAMIILDDADFQTAVADGVAKCMGNTGQTCSALTRMLVPNDRIEEAAAIAKAVAEQFTIGAPGEEGVRMGPLVSGGQREIVENYIEKGIAEGATLVLDGRNHGRETGHYVGATVFSNVGENMTIAQEEIFGPVLSIIGYKDEDDAVRIANNSAFGLSGGVWAGDKDHGIAVARRIRTGQVAVNGGAFNPAAPFGGYKQSGIGREGGVLGLEDFLEVKAIQR